MPRTALRDNKGVSLVEVMISLVILLIVFMGLIQASIVSIDVNMRNELRDEAVRLSSDLMAQLRAAPFDDLNRDGAADPANPGQLNFNRNSAQTIRSAAVPYARAVNAQWLDANHKQLTITTTWSWQGENMTHTISTYRGR
jgi:prepilin-type N-terminal cleavage/methylation domain-containing protein